MFDPVTDVLHECLDVAGRCIWTSGDEVGMTHADLSPSISFTFASGFIDEFASRDPFTVDARISKNASCGLIGHGLAGFLRGEYFLDLIAEPHRILRFKLKDG